MTEAPEKSVGETLVDLLEANDVEVVFGIPGVHTVELYRGLADSSIRHVTPRHEQGAGFMADGYARVSGKPGVCFVITGPGLLNALTAMVQAQADSVPMLVISGVNERKTLNHGQGFLHEVPDQRGMTRGFAAYSHTLLEPADLPSVIDRAFAAMGSGRPGPVHIEIPTDVMSEKIAAPALRRTVPALPRAEGGAVRHAAELCQAAQRPLLLLGGGAKQAATQLRRLAERLDAPVVTTVNARGILDGHPLSVPASPSLASVRGLLDESDLVLAIGTELGPTDLDMYGNKGLPRFARLIRVDIDREQIARGPRADAALLSSAEAAVEDLLTALPDSRADRDGAARADNTREDAWQELGPAGQADVGILKEIREALPGCLIVGDSTQLVYSGNLFCEIERVGGWFNSATGFGTLGYAPPAAVGAKIAAPDTPVVCIVGDGGIQFTLAELGTAVDEETPVIFLVWNNGGYREIENHMVRSGIEPVGVKPSPPNFQKIAEAYGLGFERLSDLADLPNALQRAAANASPALIEVQA